MGKIVAFISASLIMLGSMSCTTKKENHDHSDTGTSLSDENWPQMDAFHTIMAESFHPYKDSANLEPAKANAAQMASAAKIWVEAPLPAKVDNENVKMKLQQLVEYTEAFAARVQAGDDNAISESLAELHDLFHELQEAWYGGHDEHETHH